MDYSLIEWRSLLSIVEEKSASKIQAAFRSHQARLKLKKQAAWQIHEKLEYSSEQTEAKVRIDPKRIDLWKSLF